MSTPNILFLFSDQQRWDTCGCYGQPLDLTPNFDRMAEVGKDVPQIVPAAREEA